MHSAEIAPPLGFHRFSLEEVARIFGVPAYLLPHDRNDTRTPPAPGAIQIGPLDVS